MRRVLYIAAALVLSAAASVRADEQADLKAVIDKAIKASGGEAKLAKFKAEVFKGKGKYYGMGEGIPYTGEWSVQLPGQMCVRIETGGDMKFTFMRVVNGDKIWLKLGDETKAEDDKDKIAEAKEEGHAAYVATLLPLKDKAYKLAALGEVKVDGKDAIGVRVSHKGHRDVNLFFDKAKGLLVKSESMVKDDETGGKEVTQESLYSAYKEVNGVMRPMKLVIKRDGKIYVDAEMTEFEMKEKLDDSVFGKP